MLATTSFIVYHVFLTFYILQAGQPNRRGARTLALGKLWALVTPTLPLDGTRCVNNALINVLKN